MMRRRQVITLLGGAAASWPVTASAQQRLMPTVGFLRSTPLAGYSHLIEGFRRGLSSTGFNEGQNVAVEYRYADNRPERLPGLAAELIRLPVEVIVANVNAALAAKAATTTVPIVFVTGSDPVVDGLVASLNQPGGNVTGVSFVSGLLGPKRLDLLRQLVPNGTMAMLAGTDTLEGRIERRDVELAARAQGQQLVVATVGSEGDLDGAFASIVGRGARALLVGTGPLITSSRDRVVALAARHAIPAAYSLRELVVAGGLLSYGASIAEAYRQAGIYAGRILKGEKPADLPVVQADKFELVINLKTSKALGLQIPDKLLALADEVIE